MADLTIYEDKQEILSKDELNGLTKWVDRNQPCVSEDLAERLYSLWLQGRTCQEIHKAHGSLAFGAIVDARLRYDWDAKREVYIETLQKETESIQMNSHLGAIRFLSDLAALTNMVQSEAIMKYMATKDPAHLKDVLPIQSIKDYKVIMEILTMLGPKNDDGQPKFNQLVNTQNVTISPGGSHSDFLANRAREIAEKSKK